MSAELDALAPARVWRYFLELSAIPRPSGQEERAAAWLVAEARALGLDVERDSVGNVLIRKPASPGCEGAPTVAMQAHIDMVCEKNEDTVHDFANDPIRVRRDGEVLRATGTTLGADDGIGVAAGLAALADPSLVHPALELLVTMDEETGLTGANGLATGWLRAKILLNLDSEAEGQVTIGCAGGVDTVATRAITWEPVPEGSVPVRVKVFGAKGGHSGADICQGRANAIKVLAQVLGGLPTTLQWRLAAFDGGNKRNAIAREAVAMLAVPAEHVPALRERVAELATGWRAAFGRFDPHLSVVVEEGHATRVASEADGRALVDLLLALPHGVEARSPDIADLVQTSTNLGVLHTAEGFEVNLLTRSAIEASKVALVERIEAACRLAGFATERVGDYPGWKPEPGAAVVGVIDRAWQELAGKPVEVIAIHAGLECGLIGEKYPGMEMASFGPDVWDAHTPEERVSIPSVAKFWTLLVNVLHRLALPT
ncbi:cytosol nonspecific dipeptidase [Deltaproteobacteria bacterium]|nr:cytosol nonspecific dipeptidase [Deltaproteobacteria bacterium]